MPRPNSEAMRSPRESIAADMADTRSSSTSCGKAEAMLNPSTLTTADASISGDEACRSRKRSTISWERDFVKATAPCIHRYWCEKKTSRLRLIFTIFHEGEAKKAIQM